MAVRRLLKSCATPPASRPMLVQLAVGQVLGRPRPSAPPASSATASFIEVTSRLTPTQASRRPPRSRSGPPRLSTCRRWPCRSRMRCTWSQGEPSSRQCRHLPRVAGTSSGGRQARRPRLRHSARSMPTISRKGRLRYSTPPSESHTHTPRSWLSRACRQARVRRRSPCPGNVEVHEGETGGGGQHGESLPEALEEPLYRGPSNINDWDSGGVDFLGR